MSGNGSWLTVPLRERDGQGRKGRRGAGWRALQANRPAESGTGFFGTQAEPGGEASDDRQTEQAPVVDPAMPAAGALSLVAVLSAGTRQYGGSGADGADRPPIPGDAVLRLAQDWLRREGHVVNRKRG